MTYRLDSDILWSYGEVRTIESKKFVAPSKDAKWHDVVKDFKGEFLKA
jgi:hypothetical protein